MPLLSIKEVSKHYYVNSALAGKPGLRLEALSGVNLNLDEGRTYALVGESGCGKSTLSRLALGLEKPSSGRIIFDGQDLNSLRKSAWRALRPQMQIIFQDPMGALNPKMSVEQILSEPFIIHGRTAGMREAVAELMSAVGLSPRQLKLYPHQFSGGQRQRIGIARAIALRPRLLVADEPVSALDVSVQAQILNLLMELKREFNLTYLLIAHDLSVVTHLAEIIAIMYLGKIVEIMPGAALADPRALHPYTEGLWQSAPDLVPGQLLPTIKGETPSPLNLPSGCRFHTRCPLRASICQQADPPLRAVAPGHLLACHQRG
jgi:oligopeptide/dipeptide ABC transporter ATP-binding protein